MPRMRDNSRDYARLFLDDVPLLDVRAPVEFARGAFPLASNLPLLNDDERHRIGICYKEQGQQAAIELGHQLVGGAVRAERTRAWVQWCQQHPDGYLYCFRGGLRSQTVQQWLAEQGIQQPLVTGGYKAMRRFLIDTFEKLMANKPVIVLCARTGCGKTRIIEALPDALDLEGAAHHRGSAFGRRPGGQPSQIDFENCLAIDLLKLDHRVPGRAVIVEDESKLIGRCHVPLSVQARILHSPRVIIEEDLESRVAVTLEDYVVAPLQEYVSIYGDDTALEKLADSLRDALSRIQKRLGGDRYQALHNDLEQALQHHARSGDWQQHANWIRPLLRDYYDPMYDYMLNRREGDILFSGSRAEVMDYLQTRA